MSKAIITKDDMALLKEASELFNETGCVPGIDGEQVPAERIVPDVKEYISETIDDPEAIYDPEIWDTPGFALVLSWLAQKWQRRCHKLTPRGVKSPEQYLTKTVIELGARSHKIQVGQQRLVNVRFALTLRSRGPPASVSVRPHARHRERRLPVHRLPLRLLLQGLPSVRKFPRAGGRARPGRWYGHLPDAARAREAHSGHGRPSVPALL